jgi:hypothetical protein
MDGVHDSFSFLIAVSLRSKLWVALLLTRQQCIRILDGALVEILVQMAVNALESWLDHGVRSSHQFWLRGVPIIANLSFPSN